MLKILSSLWFEDRESIKKKKKKKKKNQSLHPIKIAASEVLQSMEHLLE